MFLTSHYYIDQQPERPRNTNHNKKNPRTTPFQRKENWNEKCHVLLNIKLNRRRDEFKEWAMDINEMVYSSTICDTRCFWLCYQNGFWCHAENGVLNAHHITIDNVKNKQWNYISVTDSKLREQRILEEKLMANVPNVHFWLKIFDKMPIMW